MMEALSLPFLQRALAAGLLVGLVASLVGVFVVLRRSAFFGDAIAHASLAGVAVGVLLNVPPLVPAAAVGLGIGLGLNRVEKKSRLGVDTILGFVLPFFMAVGLLVVPIVIALRRPLIFATFDPDGARVSGIRVDALLTLYHVLLALVVVASLKVVGIILINALLVIPAATAKLLARSLRQMFLYAPALGMGSVLVGLFVSYRLDLPSGPAIAVVGGLGFLAAWANAARRSGK